MRNTPSWAAERLGRKAAFEDIQKRGFAHAYNQAEVTDGGMDHWSPGHAFMHGYRQVVRGYWQADLI